MQGDKNFEQAPAPATLLFMGKMDIMISQIEKSLEKNSVEHKAIMDKLDKFDEMYVKKDEFAFWRWILIVGMLLSMAVASVKFILQ